MCRSTRTISVVQYLELEVHSDFAVWISVARYRGCESFAYQGSLYFIIGGYFVRVQSKGLAQWEEVEGRYASPWCNSVRTTVFIYR